MSTHLVVCNQKEKAISALFLGQDQIKEGQNAVIHKTMCNALYLQITEEQEKCDRKQRYKQPMHQFLCT